MENEISSLEQYVCDLMKNGKFSEKDFLEICSFHKLKKNLFDMMCSSAVDIFTEDESGRTALFNAAMSGNLVILRALLARGLDPMHADKYGEVPLSAALRCGNRSVAECLIKVTGNPAGIIDDEGSSLLHKAAWGNLPELAEILLDECGMDIDTGDQCGRTALHVAAYQGNTRVMKYLLERSANVNAVDRYGQTPVFSGAYDGNRKVVKMLCEYGADLTIKNVDNLTVLKYSVITKQFETALFLNGKSGIVYPNLDAAIKKHKQECAAVIKKITEKLKKIQSANG